MHTPEYEHAGYTGVFLQTGDLRKNIAQAVKILTPIRDTFDGIAFRGMSGAVPAPILALKLRKSLLLVRKGKDKEKCHSVYDVEGDKAVRSYIIVDDQISTGETVADIMKKVKIFTQNRIPGVISNGAIFRGVLLLGSYTGQNNVTFNTLDDYRVKMACCKAFGDIPPEWKTNVQTV
jgi:hypothetical protein